MKKKQKNPIGYRPSKEVEPVFDRFCSDKRLPQSRLIEYAMRFLISQGEEKMKQVIWDYMFGGLFDEKEAHKKGDHRKSA